MNIEDLKAKALAATPGPWFADEPILGVRRFIVADCGPIGKVYPADQQITHGITSMDDAQFIAAANPSAILKLIAELEAVKAERDALRARIEAAEKQEPFGYLIDFGQSKIFTDSHPVASAWDDFVAVYSMPPMPSQRDRLPDDWEENIYNAMDEAFKLGKFADGGMQNDDTQIGVEFAVRHFKKMLENKNG